MKTIQFPENKDELRNMLIQDDVVLHLVFSDLEHQLAGKDVSSAHLSANDVMGLITDVLAELGIIITWKMG